MSAIFRRATNLLSLLSDTDYNLAIHIYIYTEGEREKRKWREIRRRPDYRERY